MHAAKVKEVFLKKQLNTSAGVMLHFGAQLKCGGIASLNYASLGQLVETVALLSGFFPFFYFSNV